MEGTEEEQERAFAAAADQLTTRIRRLLIAIESQRPLLGPRRLGDAPRLRRRLLGLPLLPH